MAEAPKVYREGVMPDALFIAPKELLPLAQKVMTALHQLRPDFHIAITTLERLDNGGRFRGPLPIIFADKAVTRAHPEYLKRLQRLFARDGHHELVVVSQDRSIGFSPSPDLIVRLVDLHKWNGESRSTPLLELSALIARSTDRPLEGEFFPRVPFELAYLTKVDDLNLSFALNRALRSDNIIFIGDAAQKSGDELMMLEGMSPDTLEELRVAMASLGIAFGVEIDSWPPENIEELLQRIDAAQRVRALEQSRTGATFEAHGDHFVINPAGDENDVAAAQRPVTRQMHDEVRRKAQDFAAVAHRLDNQPGWTGLRAVAERLVALLDRPSDDIPNQLGSIYGAALELGSFLDLDNSLRSGASSIAPALDADMRRPLDDLVRTFAPWLRAFPSVREMDDDTGKFLTRHSDLAATQVVIQSAQKVDLIHRLDADAVLELAATGKREGFQADKARTRSTQTARNLVVMALGAVGSFILGTTASAYAADSVLFHKIGAFLATGEQSILHLVEGLPHDLRISVETIIEESRTLPPAPGQPPAAPPAPRAPA